MAVNEESQKLTQRLISVKQRAIKAEQEAWVFEVERSALFVSVEGHCLEKLESILEEYSACLIYAPTCWVFIRELVKKDRIMLALSRVNHSLEGTGLRLDFHFAPTRPSHGRASSGRPSMEEHWWRVPEVESIVISSDTDLSELNEDFSEAATDGETQSFRWKKKAAAKKASTTASGARTTATTGTKRKADQ